MQFDLISRKTSNQIAISTVLAFIVFALFGQYIIPDRFSYDTMNMVDIAENVVAGTDASLAVIASMVRVLTLTGMTALVQFAGCCIILYVLRDRRLVSTMLIAIYSIVLVIPLSLLRPQKEILVFLLTALCVWIVKKAKAPAWALFFTLIAYTVYSIISLRPYYALIIAMIPVLYFFEKLSKRAKVIWIILIAIGGFFIPSSIFELLRLTRDAINDLRVLYPDVEGNRSAFSNPFESASWPAFLGNYAYSAIRLNIPILFSQTPNEIALTLFSILWFYALWMAYKLKDWRARFTARLVLAHLFVLTLFEPDLGSYLRHFTSCILYIQPILLEMERVGTLQRQQQTHEVSSLSATAETI